MRVLIAAVPHFSHLGITLPYAQALQNEGHEVCVAAPAGAEEAIVAAGLAAATFGEPVALSLQNWKELGLLPDDATRQHYIDTLGLGRADADHWDVYYQYYSFNARFFLQREPRADIDGLIGFAKDWQPDLVLWDAWFPLGGVMATAAGVPHGRILIGPDYSGWAHRTLSSYDGPEQLDEPLVEALRPVTERYGLTIDDDLLLGSFTIDPLPDDLALETGTRRLPVRWIPYNGGAEKPEWLHARPAKRRVAVTIGLSSRIWRDGGDPRLPKIMAALADHDVEVIATLTEQELSGCATLPADIRTVDYVPLSQLYPTCDLAIHHGSSGTFLTTVANGLPQLIVDTDEDMRMVFSGEGEEISVSNADRDADSWVTAPYVEARGAGQRLDHLSDDVAKISAQIGALLDDPAFRRGAAELQAEWRDRPSPAGLVPELEKVAARAGATARRAA